MEVQFTPDVEKMLNELAAQSGRGPAELLQDALAGYFEEVTQTRKMLNSRYDDLKTGRVGPIGGESFFEDLRRREYELLEEDPASMNVEQGFTLHPLAAQDITEIWEYIAEDSPLAARRVREEILSTIRALVPFPIKPQTPGPHIAASAVLSGA